jgi:hypothetical protein
MKPPVLVKMACHMALVVSVSLALLWWPARAGAAPALVANSHLFGLQESALALAGPATLVAVDGGDTNVVRSFMPGSAPETVASVTVKLYGEGGHSLLFAASPSRIVVLDEGSNGGAKGTRGVPFESLESGPLGDPLSPLAEGCSLVPGLDHGIEEEREEVLDRHTNIAVDGEVVAYDSFGCVMVQDFGSGLQRTIPLPATLDPFKPHDSLNPAHPIEYWLEFGGWETKLRLAGRLIAYRANPPSGAGKASVVVYDIDTGQDLYSVPLPRDYLQVGKILSPTFGLQADGTLVIADARTCTATVSTPQDPAPRVLSIRVCAVRSVMDGRALVVVPRAHDERLLAWTPIQAPTIHPIVALGRYGAWEATQATMNETDVAYALGSCLGTRIYRTSLAEPGTPPTPPRSCPVLVPARHATLTSKRLSVRVNCPLGCEGFLRAELGTARQIRRHLGVQLEENPLYAISPGRARTFTLLPAPEWQYNEGITLQTTTHKLQAGRRQFLALEFRTNTPNAVGICEGCEDEHRGVTYSRSTRVVVPIDLAHALRRRS